MDRMIIDCTGGPPVITPVPPLTLAERKAALKADIEARAAQCFAAGFTPATGPLAGHTLQVRDNDDRTNWLTSQAAYAAAVAAGAGALPEAVFRTTANVTVTVTYQDGLEALLAMAAWGKQVMGNSWALKDAVDAAADDAELDLIDIATGWPA